MRRRISSSSGSQLPLPLLLLHVVVHVSRSRVLSSSRAVVVPRCRGVRGCGRQILQEVSLRLQLQLRAARAHRYRGGMNERLAE